MKKIITSILVISAISLSYTSFGQNDPNAKKVLDKVSTTIKSIPALSASFTYTTTDRNKNKKGTVNGTLYVKGNKFYIKQAGNEIFSNGSKTWNYNGDDEVTVQDVDASDDNSLTPQKFLSDFYDKDFTYKLMSSAGDSYEIQLIPVDKRKNFKQVNIFVNKSKNLITKARILDKSDNTIEFALSNINTNASLPDSKFVFDVSKHPGVEVVAQ
ncbi:MAG: outer membrane lipoprotein carrier protein LolA [Chitinophagaceae bacterium]